MAAAPPACCMGIVAAPAALTLGAAAICWREKFVRVVVPAVKRWNCIQSAVLVARHSKEWVPAELWVEIDRYCWPPLDVPRP